MTVQRIMVFEHRRRTRTSGILNLIGVLAFGVVMFAIFHWFEKRVPGNDWGVFPYVILSALLLFNGAIFTWQIVQNGELVCRVDDTTIECQCPGKSAGDSFKLHIADITAVQRRSHGWWIYNNAGERFWLTKNYGNPARRFVDMIRERNAAIRALDDDDES